jgi:uncharacterized protein
MVRRGLAGRSIGAVSEDDDPAKDAANIAKHGISLARAFDFDLDEAVVVADLRYDYGERRFRAYGYLDGLSYCLSFTVRGPSVRPISFRRAHAKEMRHHGWP